MNELKPRYNNGIRESELFDNDEFLTEEDAPNDGGATTQTQKAESPMDEQQLRIESLKIATKISKLFDNVQPSDLLEISDKVYNFIQHQNNSGEYDDSYGLDNQENAEEETENNDEENFEIPEEDEKNNEESSDENEESPKDEKSEETSEESDLNPEDIFDFNI